MSERDYSEPDDWFGRVRNFKVGKREYVNVTSLLSGYTASELSPDQVLGLYSGKMRTLMHPEHVARNPEPSDLGSLFFWSDCPPQEGGYGPAGSGGYKTV